MTLLGLLILFVVIATLVKRPLSFASALAVERMRDRLFCRSHDHDPGATTAKLASPDGGTTPWVFDLALYPRGLFIVKPSVVGGAGVSLVRLMAYSDSAATLNGTEIKTTGAVVLDDMSTLGGDQAVLEYDEAEIRQVDSSGVGLRYLAVEITHATNTDESVVTCVLQPRYPRTGLSATQQA